MLASVAVFSLSAIPCCVSVTAVLRSNVPDRNDTMFDISAVGYGGSLAVCNPEFGSPGIVGRIIPGDRMPPFFFISWYAGLEKSTW
jgi:hypothetical protein